jgi:predicted membrane-bound spermidine synthase
MATGKESSLLFSKVSLTTPTIHFILYGLFFCSGCSALIYQVMWQRMLFTVFGVDLESITIVVSVFMFGLGIGGLIGGRLADRMPTRLLSLYVAIELYIAIFGFFSPAIIDLMGNALFSGNEFVTAVVSFLILAIPTLLMGTTFPILVTHVNRYNQNIGDSVGGLYFVNTLGGAMGAYFSGFVLLYSMDIAGAINRAALLNLFIAFVALLVFRRQK